MSDIRKIERELLGELKARSIVVTPGVKRAVKDAAADAVLVERARAAINDGQPLDLDAFMKLRAAAEASRGMNWPELMLCSPPASRMRSRHWRR